MDAEDSQSADADQSVDDIELAYRQALEALDEAERQVGSAFNDFSLEAADDDADEQPVADGFSIGEQLANDLAVEAPEIRVEELVDGIHRVTPQQVIEAALFVGGEVALTARRLASLIGQDVDSRVAVSLIDALNQKYLRERRPCEIRLHEGGYRMELREQFHDVRMRTFGMGPREIRLSPDVLEVLAWIAWNQPVAQDEIRSLDSPNAVGNVRQLLRLQLIELQRTGEKRSDVAYVTSPRFLSLFGLESLDDLPTADVFSFR